MKKNIINIILMLLVFFALNSEVYAAVDDEIICQYSYSIDFSKYSGYKINVVYDGDFPNIRYVDSYLYEGEVDDSWPSHSARLENIITGKNRDTNSKILGINFSDIYVYLDNDSANYFINRNSCPKYAYYSSDKIYCFDNDGKYCKGELGNGVIQSTNSKSYISNSGNEDIKLNCSAASVTTVTGNNTTECNVKFEIVNNNRVEVYYKDKEASEYNKLGNNMDSFSCGDKKIYLTNTFLENPINSRSEFDTAYLNLTKDSSYCPLNKYYTYNGNKYIVLEDSFNLFSDMSLDEDENVDYDKNVDWGMNFGTDVNVEKCEDLFSDTFLKTINGYMTVIRILVPIALIALGMLDFSKAIFAGKEDDMKKAQSTFIKRLIIGIIIFFVPTIVNFILNVMNEVYGGGFFGNGTCGIR